MSRFSVAREPQGTPTGGRFAAEQKPEAHGVQLPVPGEAAFSAAMADLVDDELSNFDDMAHEARRTGGDEPPEPTLASLRDSAAQMPDDMMEDITGQPQAVMLAAIDAAIETHGADASLGVLPARPQPVRKLKSAPAPRSLYRELATMTSGSFALTVAGRPFTIFYDESPSRGDMGGPVPGSVTGDFEVCDDTPGGPGVLFRQHVSPTGQGSDTKGYAAERVMATIVRLDQASADRQRPPRPDLACAVDAHGVDPTPENRVALMAAMWPL